MLDEPVLQEIIALWDQIPEWKKQDLLWQARSYVGHDIIRQYNDLDTLFAHIQEIDTRDARMFVLTTDTQEEAGLDVGIVLASKEPDLYHVWFYPVAGGITGPDTEEHHRALEKAEWYLRLLKIYLSKRPGQPIHARQIPLALPEIYTPIPGFVPPRLKARIEEAKSAKRVHDIACQTPKVGTLGLTARVRNALVEGEHARLEKFGLVGVHVGHILLHLQANGGRLEYEDTGPASLRALREKLKQHGFMAEDNSITWEGLSQVECLLVPEI